MPPWQASDSQPSPSPVSATSYMPPSGQVHVPPQAPVLGAGEALLPVTSFSVGPSQFLGGGGACRPEWSAFGPGVGFTVMACLPGGAGGYGAGRWWFLPGQGAQKTRLPVHGPEYWLHLPETPPWQARDSQPMPLSLGTSATSYTPPSGQVHVPPQLPVSGACTSLLPVYSFSCGPSQFVGAGGAGALAPVSPVRQGFSPSPPAASCSGVSLCPAVCFVGVVIFTVSAGSFLVGGSPGSALAGAAILPGHGAQKTRLPLQGPEYLLHFPATPPWQARFSQPSPVSAPSTMWPTPATAARTSQPSPVSATS